MVTDATGDVHEALVSFSHSVGPVNPGFSPGVRFGSGDERYISFAGVGAAASYQYQDRYREGGAVPTSYINHLYDSSETIMVGIETVFLM